MTAQEERARARAQWTARLVQGNDPGEDGRHNLSPEEAWLAVGQLTRSMWLLAGNREAFPPRTDWPARLYHRGEVRDDGSPQR